MIYDFLFPKKCLECGLSGKYICDSCLSKVPPGSLRNDNYSIFVYTGIIRKAITSLKYKFAFDIADELVGRLVNLLISNKFFLNKKIILVPIPLYKLRQNWRGFNQSELIGEKLAKLMGWKFIPDFLSRIKNSKPQVGLKSDKRSENLAGVFSVNPNYVLSTKYSVLLFDDVYTTGSTINEAKKTIENAKVYHPKDDQPWAGNIYSLTIAKQELKNKN